MEDIIYLLNVFFMIYMFLYAIIFFFSIFFSIVDLEKFFKRRKFMNNMTLSNKLNYMPISIIVPAYNEEVTIIESIDSLLHLDYPEYEIVIINDGSTDGTSSKVIEKYGLKRVYRPIRKLVNSKDCEEIFEKAIGQVTITLINKENGGKADSLNMGINVSRYPLFLSLDADSVLQEDTLSKMVEPFMEDDKTVAVGGNVKISNSYVIENGKIIGRKPKTKLIVLFQIVEYYRSFLSTRVSFNKMNSNLIISGAIGLFKKQSAIGAGGYESDTVGEDMEMVIKLHTYCIKNRIDYNIGYVPDAVCWTQVPEKLSDLKKQRRRWHMGLTQSLWEHKYVFINPRYGAVGLVAYIYYVFFELLAPIIELLGIVIIPLSYYIGLLNFDFMVLYLGIFILYSFIVSVASITFESYLFRNTISLKMGLVLIGISFLECFGFRQLCSLYRLSAFIGYKKNKLSWEKITRVHQGR
ncbi:glycosyltransferase family 2 protein [Clostridium cylindrosporum]|uniref:Poly-beta-1,6-N-acetyl-D-glucosamine synthase IcaA n=1 Tax=Clostridium cylindrosporum DSM 605 TaxID=1121307 RepID=A0A0J8D8K9_CLOCY|nr:glycosyltransferase [Clostridium cylindrosporum]KMT22217.1 poly-beta-1,6-N-acetyl-D-glucosamine synthase IcaA [Clostridium cylindrosporum DSM 605]